MAYTISIFNRIEELARFFAIDLAAGVEATPERRFYSIALSGGSTPKVVFENIASNFTSLINWQKVQIYWGDERCVAPESHESNFRMAQESLLDHIPIPSSNIHRIRGEADPEIESERYEQVVRQYVPAIHNIPQLDLIMLGLGEDGHTASIFPENIHLFKTEKLIEVVENPYTKQKRITMTGSMINHARKVIFLITGESKAEIVARIIENGQGWEKCPASLVQPENGHLIWLIDDRAASKLKSKSIKKD